MSNNLASEIHRLVGVLNQKSNRGLVLAGAAYLYEESLSFPSRPSYGKLL